MKAAALIGALATVGFLAFSGAAIAKTDPETARAKASFAEGEKQYNLGRFEEALEAYQAAYLAKPLPGLLFNVAQCHRMLEHHKDAARTYRRFLDGLPDAPNRPEVERLIAAEEEALRNERHALPPTGTVAPSGPAERPIEKEKPVVATPATPPVAQQINHPSDGVSANATTPVYKKWWLWTLVAVAAAGGVGLGLGLTLGAPKDTPLDQTAATTLSVSF